MCFNLVDIKCLKLDRTNVIISYKQYLVEINCKRRILIQRQVCKKNRLSYQYN